MSVPSGPPQHGITLIELLVALAVGSILILGSLNLVSHARGTFAANEAIARLQDNARFALDVLESDLLLAGYAGPVGALSAEHHATLTAVTHPAGIAVGNDCGPDWTVALQRALDAASNRYDFSCAPYQNRSQPGSDTLVVRRADAAAATARAAHTLYVASAPFTRPVVFVGPALPPAMDAASVQVHRLIVNGYYVSPTSTLSAGGRDVPSLRVKTLQSSASGPRIVDQEVLPGVEDLQLEFGIDTDAPGTPGHGAVNRYVHPEDPMLQPSLPAASDIRIAVVRIWIRVRAGQPEAGFVDTTHYRYADVDLLPPEDAYRRLVATRTITLRNPVRPQ